MRKRNGEEKPRKMNSRTSVWTGLRQSTDTRKVIETRTGTETEATGERLGTGIIGGTEVEVTREVAILQTLDRTIKPRAVITKNVTQRVMSYESPFRCLHHQMNE